MNRLKLVFLFIPLLFTSCAGFLNETFSTSENLADCFSAKINGIEVISFPSLADDLEISSIADDKTVTLTATTGFSSYLWSLDGKTLSDAVNSVVIALEKLESGWHLVTIVACDAQGNYRSASLYIQATGEKSTSGTSVFTAFFGTDSKTCALSYTKENETVTFTATSGFLSYAWTLDGIPLNGTTNVTSIDLTALDTGMHIVTVIAKDDAGIYYSASAQISKTTMIEPDIRCSGIAILFPQENATPFSVTSVTGADSAAFTATGGFSSYSWTLDGTAITGTDNTATITLASVAAGFHIVTVTAYSSDGIYYSATMYIQKTAKAGSVSTKAGTISIGFEEATSSVLSISQQNSDSAVTLTATNGFDAYSWTLDGETIASSGSTATVELHSLAVGWHLVTVTAVKDERYYSASTYIQRTGE